MEGTSARTPRERKAAQRYSPSPPVPRGRARQKCDRRLGESQEFLDRLASRVEPAGEAQSLIEEEEEESGEEQEDLDQDWLPEGAAAVVGSLAAAAAQEEGAERRSNAASFFLKERQLQQEVEALHAAVEFQGLPALNDHGGDEEEIGLWGNREEETMGLLPEATLGGGVLDEVGVEAVLPCLLDSEAEESDEDSDNESGDEDKEAREEQIRQVQLPLQARRELAGRRSSWATWSSRW